MGGRFHRLTNNQSDFPHLDNVNTYAYDNKLDYGRFNCTQMELQICKVPWDVGEAHVGQRTISGIGNVVYFGSEENRDAWFEAIPDDECIRLETRFKELHRDQTIDVPLPFDVAAKYNYLAVRYNLFANDESPLAYETDDGIRKWFWFIREVEFVAPNTTRLHLIDDAWQTWIYKVDVTGMVLERGHAPMFATTTDEYLSDPVGNCADLLAEDVDYGRSSIVRDVQSRVLNAENMRACVATTANPRDDWGTKVADNWHVPASPHYANNGVPSVYILSMAPADLSTFLENVTDSIPQFKQTIQGVFFASSVLLDFGASFVFGGVECRGINSSRKTLDLCKLNRESFGYPGRYADIAKLYTYPYAHIEVTDETGKVDIIRIEDTDGRLDVSASLSLAYPAINISAHILGNGGTGGNVTFSNINARSFDFDGRWYETLRKWDVPTFAVVLDPAKEWDYSTHFDRKQRVIDYDTTYDDTLASAAATRDDAYDSADTSNINTNLLTSAAKGNADAEADTIIANTAIQTSANATITSTSNAAALSDASLSNALSQALQAWEAGYTRDTTNNEVDAAYASAAIGAAGGAAQGAISGMASGASMGPAGMAAGAITGLVSGAISGATSMAQTAVAANLKSTQAEATVAVSQNKVNATSTNNNDRTNNQNSANSSNTATSNSASTGVSANSAATTKGNASRTKTANDSAAGNTRATARGNAARDYNTASANATRDRNAARDAVTNDTKQAALRAPFVYGSFSNMDSATTKPMALFANVVTQDDYAIRTTGDEFLRYGYRLGRQWDFDGNWNIGRHFTYWKLSDFWVRGLSVSDLYMDKLRFFLFGGVTVWRRPEDIGNVTIYDNFGG